jgi:AhpD family alkylhydroperoxidase
MEILQARMDNPAILIPEAMKALYALKQSAEKTGVPSKLLTLLELRASQINGCSVCVDMHSRELKKAGEPDERIFTVAAWRETPYFTDAERAALALTEALTRISDRADAVPEDVWNKAAKYFDEQKLAGLVIAIASINVWNRFNVATRQLSGEWTGSIK